MPDHKPAISQVLPPHIQLIQMGRAHIVSRAVYAAAKLGLADQLASGPKNAIELAGPMDVHAPSLHRLMRTLASLGILTEQPEQRFALTGLGEALKTGAPGSARSSVIFSGSPSLSGWDNVVYSVQTGKTGFEKAQGLAFFDYLAQHPEDASLFSEMMVGLNDQEPPAVAAAYDFSIFQAIVDVGGATGNMLAAVLSRHAGPHGILFDRPHVVKDAPALLDAKGVSDRVTIQPGNFFDCRMLSITILIGHGSRTSLKVSPSTATNARVSAFQCGRMRRAMLNFPGWFERGAFGLLSSMCSFCPRDRPFRFEHWFESWA